MLEDNNLMLFSRRSFSVVQFPVDEPTFAWIMTHDYTKDLCASELRPLKI